MPDDSATYTTPAPMRSRSGTGIVVAALLGLLLGALLVGLAMSHGMLNRFLPADAPSDAAGSNGTQTGPSGLEGASGPMLAVPDDMASGAVVDPALHPLTNPQQVAQISSIEGRLAMIEDRLSRIDYQTSAASGNAARAEGLLIAFAARRMVDRGAPLSYIADQLRLRFADAQPNAVKTIIAFSQNPVTIDELSARLEALAPKLSGRDPDEGLWKRMRRELGSLFVVRTDDSTLLSPSTRMERAKLMLTSRRIDDAIAEVQRMPGAAAAQTWIADAHRYAAVQSALDLLETTAMLDPRRLHDSQGNQVSSPSPLAPATAQGATGQPAPNPDGSGPAGTNASGANASGASTGATNASSAQSANPASVGGAAGTQP